MTDYKRLISYMYQYENGIKKSNVGYARIEAKSGQCKITLHLQLPGQSDSIFPTYLIHREAPELIYIGDSVLKNQTADSKFTLEEVNIKGSGYGLSDMGGLLIFLNNNIVFASGWDDKPIIANELLDAMKPKKKSSDNSGIIAESLKDEINIMDTAVKKSDSGYTTEGNTINSAEIIPEDNIKSGPVNSMGSRPDSDSERGPEIVSLEDELRIPKYKLPRGWKTVEMFQRPVAEKEIDQPKEEPKLAVKEEQIDDIAVLPIEEYQTEEAEQPAVNEAEEQDNNQTAKYLFDNYPRIYPFEDNEIQLCVKIEPKDIGLLPKDIWSLSGNSFLMHGFYCYHHLIFAKKKDDENGYILGIPGIYHNREQFMARMFGFESFKSIRKRELRQGDFGYWYLQVNL